MPAIIGNKIGEILSTYAQPFRQPDGLRAARFSRRLRPTLGYLKMAIDWIEVSRVSYQIELDHGGNAYPYAARLAAKAKEESLLDESEFWEAVAASLRPRDLSPNSSFNTDALKRAG